MMNSINEILYWKSSMLHIIVTYILNNLLDYLKQRDPLLTVAMATAAIVVKQAAKLSHFSTFIYRKDGNHLTYYGSTPFPSKLRTRSKYKMIVMKGQFCFKLLNTTPFF